MTLIDARGNLHGSDDGRFAHKPRSAAAGSLDDATISPSPQMFAAIEAVRDGEYRYHDLLPVDADARLSREQIGMYLAGEEEALTTAVWDEWATHRRDASVQSIVEDLRERHGLTDDVDVEELRDAIVAHASTEDPVALLARRTPLQLMRVPLTTDGLRMHARRWSDEHDGADAADGRGSAASDARIEIVAIMLAEHGIDVADRDVRADIAELVDNGPIHWHDDVHLDVLWQGDITDAAARPGAERVLQMPRPHIVLLDRDRGTGVTMRLRTTIRVPVTTQRPATLDADGHGYGWAESSGIDADLYRVDVDGTTYDRPATY